MAAEVVGSVPTGEVGGVPAPVAAALRLLRRVERERAVRARRWSDARACDLADGDQVLAVVEAVEAVKAWADSLALAATRRMVEVLDAEDDRYAAPRIGAAARAELADAAVSEIAAATGLGEREVGRRVALATGQARTGSTRCWRRCGPAGCRCSARSPCTRPPPGSRSRTCPRSTPRYWPTAVTAPRPHRPRSATGSVPRSSATTPTPANAPAPEVCATAPPGSGRSRTAPRT